MKILLVGNGAREHILAKKFTDSPKCDSLIVYGDKVNPGIKELSTSYQLGALDDMETLRAFAEKEQPDFAFIGPENPIADGAVDSLKEINIPSASPTLACGQLESSKSFTRNLLKKYNISGNPGFKTFKTEEGLLKYAQELGQIVVKSNGLHGGKGVKVQGDHFQKLEEGVEFAKECIKADGEVVIEEKLVGQEFSLLSFTDGKSVTDMPISQDHKRAFENDEGPNTGGMGTYSYADKLPFLTDQDIHDAHQITVQVTQAIQKELGEPFKGVMYGGFMAVKNGIRLIEYNARFGDPEVMNVLSLLQTDLVDICQAIIHGNLDQLNIQFEKKATVCKYVVPEGYPTNPKKGVEFKVSELPEGVDMYFGSVSEENGKLLMMGSRTLAFVAKADTIEEAQKIAQKGVECVEGSVFYRKDIGTQALIGKRIQMMQKIRNN